MKTSKTTTCLALFVSLLLPAGLSAQKTQDSKSGAAATAGATHKLDPNIVEAMRQSGGNANGHSTMPSAAIPVRDGDRIMVDVTANVSEDLRSQVTKLGGKLLDSPDPHHIIRAMMPLQQMEALASRPDVVSIAPAQLSYSNGAQPISR